MNQSRPVSVEELQKMVAGIVATNPVGRGLDLIGGFRYRLLDNGPRRSMDIDYNWEGELDHKQNELAHLLSTRFLPDVKRRFGLDGNISTGNNPAVASPFVRVVNLAVWGASDGGPRLELPIDITRIIRFDRPIVRTVDGVVYRTVSDSDLIESKVMSIFQRTWLEHRDMVDVFLFSNHLPPDYPERLTEKMRMAGVDTGAIAKRMDDFVTSRSYHCKALSETIDSQLDPEAAERINSTGGGVAVLDSVLAILNRIQIGAQTQSRDTSGRHEADEDR